MLKAGAVTRDFEPAAPNACAIDAKPETAAGDQLALPRLRELAEQEDPIARVPPAREAPTADTDAPSHGTTVGHDAHVDGTPTRPARLGLSRIGQQPTQRWPRHGHAAQRRSDRGGGGRRNAHVAMIPLCTAAATRQIEERSDPVDRTTTEVKLDCERLRQRLDEIAGPRVSAPSRGG